MRSRFKPDAEAGVSARPAAMLIDPEAYDASEQQFAASLEETFAQSRPRFVVQGMERIESAGASLIEEQSTEASVGRPDALQVPSANRILPAEQDVSALSSPMQTRAMPMTRETPAVPPVQAKLIQEGAVSWRQEVAARVNNYRARRHPPGPRYPSLRLKFEASEPPLLTLAMRQALAIENAHPVSAGPEVTAKVLEFPRSAAGPPRPLDELAEPVLDRPRILEAPELVPSPPALGAILMDPAEEKENEKRPGFEMPLQPAPMSRRLVAVIIDAALVLSAFTGFACIFFRITNVVPPQPQAAGIAVTL